MKLMGILKYRGTAVSETDIILKFNPRFPTFFSSLFIAIHIVLTLSVLAGKTSRKIAWIRSENVIFAHLSFRIKIWQKTTKN